MTQESRKFIEDLRAYLFTQGKDTEEVDDIIQELSEHLYEAEQNGKSIKEVVGESPKEYMESLSSEITNDWMSWWFKYIPLIILGATSILIVDDLIQGELSYSLLDIISYPLFTFVFISGAFIVVGYTAKNQLSKPKEILLSAILLLICTSLFITYLIMDHEIDMPIIDFGFWGEAVVITLMLMLVTGFSIWARTAILPVVLIVWYVPPFFLSYTPLGETIQSIGGTTISLAILGLYLIFVFKDEDE